MTPPVQRYRCHHCDSIFNDLTETIFSGHQLSIPEMFYIIREIEESTTEKTVQELDRTYKTVLDFVNEIKDSLVVTIKITSDLSSNDSEKV